MKEHSKVMRWYARIVVYLNYAFLGYVFVVCGCLGYRITQWEAATWPFITLLWMYAANTQSRRADRWERLAVSNYELFFGRAEKTLLLRPEDDPNNG